MSGHNRWSKIKHKKEAMGASKGKLFTKLIKEITVAARMGGGDPAGNARLRAAMDAAKEANMPADNIARAVKKGTGELEGVHYDEVHYEGYGPAGVALIVECLTDNTNRTATEIRTAFSKGGGHLAAVGAVAWKFERRGVIEVRAGPTEDQVTEAAIDAGAEEVVDHGADGFEVDTHPEDLHGVATGLEQRGLRLGARKLTFVPRDTVKVTDPEQAAHLLRLLALLDDQDDVQAVHADAEIEDQLLERLG
ncbi:MAG: YebC/PmpR family DNA-binding transcriptional regulator [Anaeromyxobacter sp.]